MSSSPRKTRKPKPAERARKRPARDPLVGLSVRCWGVRGSIPAPGDKTARYGGNTPCVEIRCGDDRMIFDLGTGVRALGDENAGAPLTAHVFITHYHYDHLQGLPFFTPMFDPRSRFTILGPTRNGKTVKDVIVGQMQQPYFPVTAEMVFRAQLDYRPIAEGDRIAISSEATVTALEVNHPGGNLAYRVDYRGKSVVFATDHEHGQRDTNLEEFSRGTDLILYDAMYSEDEYRGHGSSPKIGWGHSTWQSAIELANKAQAKKLVLFHHDPTRSDAALDAVLKQVRKHRPEAIAAREGDVLKL